MMLKAALKFARPRVTIMLWALAFIGAAATGDITWRTSAILILLTFWYIHATTINDYTDLAIDKINLKDATDRPLVSGALSLRQLWFLHYFSGAVALGLSFIYGRGAVYSTLLMFVVDYAYSLKPFRLSDRGIYALLLLSFVYVYYPIALGHWSTTGENIPRLLWVGIFLAFLARMLLKDFRDVKGDKKHNKHTFLLLHGKKTTIRLSATLWILSVVCIGYQIHQFFMYPLLLIGIFEVFFLLKVLSESSLKNDEQTAIIFVAKTANALMITLLTYSLCTHQNSLSSIEVRNITLTTGTLLLLFNWKRYTSYRKIVTTPTSASTSTS